MGTTWKMLVRVAILYISTSRAASHFAPRPESTKDSHISLHHHKSMPLNEMQEHAFQFMSVICDAKRLERILHM